MLGTERDPRTVELVLVVSILLGVGAAGCSPSTRIPSLFCSARDERLAPKLARQAVLKVHPPGATLQGRSSGCDEDDGFAYAGRAYNPVADTDEVVAFYQRAVPAEGWKLRRINKPDSPHRRSGRARLCFTKTIDETTAHLSVWFVKDMPLPEDEPTDDFTVEITASHDGGAWC